MLDIVIKGAEKIVSGGKIFSGDIGIKDGKIVKIGTIDEEAREYISAKGLTAIPGLVDMHVHFRDPGLLHKEDIFTGAEAAANGGVTSVCTMPNTSPAADSVETIEYMVDKARGAKCRVYPSGCITLGMKGRSLCDFVSLKESGAVAVSDDGRPVEDEQMMEAAVKAAAEAGVTIISHCEDLKIINGGIINKGKVSEKLGVAGMDRRSEIESTKREIEIAKRTGLPVHIAHVSVKECVRDIREAKVNGVKVTAETAPHYFYYTDEKLLSMSASYRMNPPLREKEDIEAIIEGIADGTIDAIATDHAPHAKEEKANFHKAPNGVIGLESSFGASYTRLVKGGVIGIERLVELMSEAPARILNIPAGRIEEGANADITLIDEQREWVFAEENIKSKSKNSAFIGERFVGYPVITVCRGEVVKGEELIER